MYRYIGAGEEKGSLYQIVAGDPEPKTFGIDSKLTAWSNPTDTEACYEQSNAKRDVVGIGGFCWTGTVREFWRVFEKI